MCFGNGAVHSYISNYGSIGRSFSQVSLSSLLSGASAPNSCHSAAVLTRLPKSPVHNQVIDEIVAAHHESDSADTLLLDVFPFRLRLRVF